MNECVEDISTSLENCLRLKISDMAQTLKRVMIKSIQQSHTFDEFYTTNMGKIEIAEFPEKLTKWLELNQEWVVYKDLFEDDVQHFVYITNAGSVIYEQTKSSSDVSFIEYEQFKKQYDEQYPNIKVPQYRTSEESIEDYKFNNIVNNLFLQFKHDNLYDIIVLRGICPLSNEIIKCLPSVFVRYTMRNGFKVDKKTCPWDILVRFWQFVNDNLTMTWEQVKLMKMTKEDMCKRDLAIESMHWSTVSIKDGEIMELKRINRVSEMKINEISKDAEKLRSTVFDLETKLLQQQKYTLLMEEKAKDLEKMVRKFFEKK